MLGISLSVSFDEQFELWGEAEVRRQLLLSENCNSIMLRDAPAWLATKDAERIARSEVREDSTLKIAKRSNIIAISAMILSIITAASIAWYTVKYGM